MSPRTELQSRGAEPLYRQLISRLQSSIDNGSYAVGDRLPSEEELCRSFGVSRITVRRAVQELEKAGILEKQQGRGTFVCQPGNAFSLKRVSSFHEACRRCGCKPSIRAIYAKTVPASEEDVRELQLGRAGKVVETLRLCLADGVPVIMELNRFSMAYSYLTECDLSGSLYSLLREFGIEPAEAEHTISLCRAGENEASLLGVRAGDPLLLLREIIYDQKGRPLHSSRQYIRGDRFAFQF